MSKANSELGDLLKHLRSDIESEKMYWIRNDAKLRAVVTSKSYDEFREIVDAAHLKSLSREDGKKKITMSWNRAAMSTINKNEDD